MQGVDVFDMKPLDSSRKGTLAGPRLEQSLGVSGCVLKSGPETNVTGGMKENGVC